MFKNIDKRAIDHARRNGIAPNHRRLAQYANPRINRWTGKPHEHKREIARHLRQQGRA